MIKRKKKNPLIGKKSDKEPLKKLKAEALLPDDAKLIFLNRGGYGEETYLFVLKNISKLYVFVKEDLPLILKPGRYILKFHLLGNVKKDIDFLKQLSDLDLIPKIYYIDDKIMIQQFVDSVDIRHIHEELFLGIRNKALKLYLYNNLSNELKRWHSNGITHGDVAGRNIILSTSGKIWLIDPMLEDGEEYVRNYKTFAKNQLKDIQDLEALKQMLLI